MKHPHILIGLLTITLLTTNCSPLKPSQPTVHRSVTTTQHPEFVTPEANHQPPKEPLPKPATEAKPKDHTHQSQIPSADFTRLEREHVKFSNHDPFPPGENTYILDLDHQQTNFTFPLNISRFSSGYGMRSRRFHSGIDLLESAGAPIYAAFDGVVRISKPYSGYGNIVVLRHPNGLETIYAHNTTNLVQVGDIVRSGDKIATIGRTGQASANHLHFEVRVLGQTFDPKLLINLDTKTLQRGTLKIRRQGDKITCINPKADTNPSTRPSQPNHQTTTTPTTSTNSSATQYHTIVKGDTLYALSRKYGTSVTSICKLNNITEKTTLALNRKLRVK